MAARRSAPRAAVLSRRALNRALLARQHLLARASMPAGAMIEHLVGMQAQNPLDPYVALWSRLDGFGPDELASLILNRRAVRIGLLRTTLHLTTADDALALWPVVRPVLQRAWAASPFRKQLPGVDIGAVVMAGRALLELEPRTTSALGVRLHEQWPEHDATSLGYAARFLLPIVQLPPRGVWGRTGQPTWTTLEACLGRPVAGEAAPDGAVLRYLGAFGPATAADVRSWSWLTGLRQVVERLRARLVTFRDKAGRELFDLPGRPPARSGDPRSAPLPARLRQPAALARRSEPGPPGRRARTAYRLGGLVPRRRLRPRPVASRSQPGGGNPHHRAVRADDRRPGRRPPRRGQPPARVHGARGPGPPGRVRDRPPS